MISNPSSLFGLLPECALNLVWRSIDRDPERVEGAVQIAAVAASAGGERSLRR